MAEKISVNDNCDLYFVRKSKVCFGKYEVVKYMRDYGRKYSIKGLADRLKYEGLFEKSICFIDVLVRDDLRREFYSRKTRKKILEDFVI